MPCEENEALRAKQTICCLAYLDLRLQAARTVQWSRANYLPMCFPRSTSVEEELDMYPPILSYELNSNMALGDKEP